MSSQSVEPSGLYPVPTFPAPQPRFALGSGLVASALVLAHERAVTYLVNERLEERRATHGGVVGIQSRLATDPGGSTAIDLTRIADGLVEEDERDGLSAAAGLTQMWQEIADSIHARLGFPLEPELFSNMLFVGHVGAVDHPYIRRLATTLLKTFHNSDANGLYHFFTSLRFAGDIDCTAAAARARIVMRDLGLDSSRSITDLRQVTDRILRSAAVCDVAEDDNVSHGKRNGTLYRHVFKVYLDDHEIHGAEFDRGLKNNPVVVASALFPILHELAGNLRRPGDMVPLKEFVAGSDEPRTGTATVADILSANLSYLAHYIRSGSWERGCRYYPSPDAFLYFYSELVREFPEVTEPFGLRPILLAGVERRRRNDTNGVDDPWGSLNAALRAIAARNFGMDSDPELEHLVRTQDPDGSWSDFGALYCLGSTTAPRIYFGSPAQTTAYAVRALSPTPWRCIRVSDPRRRLLDTVVKRMRARVLA